MAQTGPGRWGSSWRSAPRSLSNGSHKAARRYCLSIPWRRPTPSSIAAANNLLSAACDKRAAELEKHEKWLPPRVTEAEAIEQAMGMAERWNRMFLRTLRALRDLRRYAATVMIQNAGQVNIGGQQVNVAEQTGC